MFANSFGGFGSGFLDSNESSSLEGYSLYSANLPPGGGSHQAIENRVVPTFCGIVLSACNASTGDNVVRLRDGSALGTFKIVGQVFNFRDNSQQGGTTLKFFFDICDSTGVLQAEWLTEFIASPNSMWVKAQHAHFKKMASKIPPCGFTVQMYASLNALTAIQSPRVKVAAIIPVEESAAAIFRHQAQVMIFHLQFLKGTDSSSSIPTTTVSGKLTSKERDDVICQIVTNFFDRSPRGVDVKDIKREMDQRYPGSIESISALKKILNELMNQARVFYTEGDDYWQPL